MAKNETRAIDKRVIRTKRAIRNAFTELLAEKDINFITVKDIAERANINRKTFYNYYSGIYQVVEELERELVNTFESALSDINLQHCLTNPRLIFDRIDTLICSDLEFYGNIFCMNENMNIITKLTTLIKSRTKRAVCTQVGLSEDRADVALEFVISGMVSVYQMWFKSDRKRPISDMSGIVATMCFEGLKGILLH